MARMDDVFNYIVSHKQANDGNSPSLRQIGAALGINSTSQVAGYLDKLAIQGKLYVENGKIIVTGGVWKLDPNSLDTGGNESIVNEASSLRSGPGW